MKIKNYQIEWTVSALFLVGLISILLINIPLETKSIPVIVLTILIIFMSYLGYDSFKHKE